MEKRGMKHVEIVLSFVLFIGISIFAIYFINPYGHSRTSDSLFYSLYLTIIENSSISVEKYSIFISEDSNPGSGGGAENLILVKLGHPIKKEMTSRAINLNGEDIKSSILDYEKGEIVLNYGSSGKELISVYLAEDFFPNEFQGSERKFPEAGKERQYKIASLYIEKAISEKRIGALKKEYDSDYNSLHRYFDIPRGSDFGFALNNIKAERSAPAGVDISVRNERFLTLSNEPRMGDSLSYKGFEVKKW